MANQQFVCIALIFPHNENVTINLFVYFYVFWLTYRDKTNVTLPKLERYILGTRTSWNTGLEQASFKALYFKMCALLTSKQIMKWILLKASICGKFREKSERFKHMLENFNNYLQKFFPIWVASRYVRLPFP